jgi:cystathionine beta-synthase
VFVTPTAVEPDDPRSYYSVAKRLAAETPNAILANQYHNPENPRSHYQTTGPEIWEQTGGLVTDVVMGMGTGGTISGVGRYLKEQNPNIRIIGADPVGSLLLETWQAGRVPEDAHPKTYKVEGIGEDFLPTTLDLSLIDHIVRVEDKESFLWARRLVKEEGIFAGGSSGSALAAAIRYAQTLPADRVVVVILPDSGSRYLSKFYDDQWMRENGFLSTEWSESSLGDILTSKPIQGLITASINDRMTDVIAQMKLHDISQMPVLYSDGKLGGVVTEIGLLKHMLESNHTHSPDETISEVFVPTQTVFPVNTPVETVLPIIMDGQVVLVTEQDHPVGILTKIDVLDYIAQGI